MHFAVVNWIHVQENLRKTFDKTNTEHFETTSGSKHNQIKLQTQVATVIHGAQKLDRFKNLLRNTLFNSLPIGCRKLLPAIKYAHEPIEHFTNDLEHIASARRSI